MAIKTTRGPVPGVRLYSGFGTGADAGAGGCPPACDATPEEGPPPQPHSARVAKARDKKPNLMAELCLNRSGIREIRRHVCEARFGNPLNLLISPRDFAQSKRIVRQS
jgi:hypothetical protein